MHRRDMLKLGLAASGALLIRTNRANAAEPVKWPTGGNFDELSPEIVSPFSVELNRTTFKTALAGGAAELKRPENGGVEPNRTVYPQVTGDDVLTTYRNSLERIVALQQRNSANNRQFRPRHFYTLRVQQASHAFHSKPPYKNGSVIWGYDGLYPGPTFKSRHGEPILVRIFNDLVVGTPKVPSPKGIPPFGNARISTHLHNGHTASESDGNPADVYPPLLPYDSLRVPTYPKSIQELTFRDHHYAMFRAGLDPSRDASESAPNVNDGDPAEAISTLWYHDHSIHFTAQNTYKGLVGVHLIFDEIDSGDENDPNPQALRLPSGEFDVPLLIQDKQFRRDANGDAQLFLPQVAANNQPLTFGVLGDVFAVNGQLKPKLTVKRRKYRFRLVNAGPSRFYQFYLTKRNDDQTPPDDQAFTRIGNDETLLESPYEIPKDEGLLLAVAERADVVIDFKNYQAGDKLYLVNRLLMLDTGEGPSVLSGPPQVVDVVYETVKVEGTKDPGDCIIQFEVSSEAVVDRSRLPSQLRKNPALPTVSLNGLSVAASKGQTVVIRNADIAPSRGFVFTNETLVLLKGQDPATKPGAVLKQTDNLGLYGKAIPGATNGPEEIARFEVINEIPAPIPFQRLVGTTGTANATGSLGRAAGSSKAVAEVTVDATAGATWTCGIQNVPPSQLKTLGNYREFEFKQLTEIGSEWVINDRPFSASPAGAAKIRVGRLDVPRYSLLPGADAPDGEVWTIRSRPGDWAHPVHIHLEEFQILWRNGQRPKEYERCKKDVLRLDTNSEVQIFIRFRDFLGKYPIHCHNVLHEDHEMMLRFDVVGDQ